MFSGVSAENIKENHLGVLGVSAVNVYLYKEENHVQGTWFPTSK